ncbi:chemotaxis protein CheW [Pigmentibacter sp. JX0631]|uniref:chemotaxis protein CheW n=1 Tax=Pigmentibacter sp. JX0631 TaxID=2976982 RepID=UPI002468B62D|nr:chemotaxis protein CheW [Pigmentibacter sp. JX0631]WGL59128.1 chemotaxis protein CheW [Pigmentibacter sp. JX0631]
MSNNKENLKILWIDDENDLLEIGKEIIIKAGYIPIFTSDVNEGLELFKNNIEDLVLVLCDYMMPGLNGFELRKKTLEFDDKIPFGIISAYVSKQMALEALNLKICGFYEKPFQFEKMLEIVKKNSKDRSQNILENRAIEATFFEEAISIIDEVEEKLILLEDDRNNGELINSIARELHTLKGSSGCLTSNIITKYVHKYEDIFQNVKKNNLLISDGILNTLFIGFDRIKELVGAIQKRNLHTFSLEKILNDLNYNEKENEKSDTKEEKRNNIGIKVKENISVPVVLLDELASYSGEITVIRNMVLKIIHGLEVKYVENKEIHVLSELFEEMTKINSVIQNKISEICKVPIGSIFKPLQRIIKDISKELNKNIQLMIEGDTIRVANSIAEVCSNCIIHLVRNSADHGIETPEERGKLNKQAKGTIQIKCEEDNNDFILNIQDDGRGIDQERVKLKALEKAIYTQEQINKMTEKEILEIIFAPGFSTASKVTDISGRGVGMDMVKSSVEAINGKLTIESNLNRGTKFSLKLPKPKSVTILNSLIIEISERTFAVPEESIEIILRIKNEEFIDSIFTVFNQKVLKRQNVIYPLVELDKILNLKPVNKGNTEYIEILVIRNEGYSFAIIIDNIIDSEEIVLKKIPNCFNFGGIFAGATFMGDGSVGLVLDAKKIAEFTGIKKITQNFSKESNLDINKSKQNSNMLVTKLEEKSMFAFPLEYIFRIEEIPKKNIQKSGALDVIQYREQVMPVYNMANILNLTKNLKHSEENMNVVVVKNNEQFVGFTVEEVLDIVERHEEIDAHIIDRIGILGNVQINGKTVSIIDVPNVLYKISISASLGLT